jgi:hypothetical protein
MLDTAAFMMAALCKMHIQPRSVQVQLSLHMFRKANENAGLHIFLHLPSSISATRGYIVLKKGSKRARTQSSNDVLIVTELPMTALKGQHQIFSRKIRGALKCMKPKKLISDVFVLCRPPIRRPS